MFQDLGITAIWLLPLNEAHARNLRVTTEPWHCEAFPLTLRAFKFALP